MAAMEPKWPAPKEATMHAAAGPTQEDQGDDDQGDGGHPGMLVGDASQDGIQSQKIPLGHDVRWRGEWVGVDRVVWVAEGDWGSESNQGYTDGPHDSAHKVFDE